MRGGMGGASRRHRYADATRGGLWPGLRAGAADGAGGAHLRKQQRRPGHPAERAGATQGDDLAGASGSGNRLERRPARPLLGPARAPPPHTLAALADDTQTVSSASWGGLVHGVCCEQAPPLNDTPRGDMEQQSDNGGTAAPAGVVILASAERAGSEDTPSIRAFPGRIADRGIPHARLTVAADGRLQGDASSLLSACTLLVDLLPDGDESKSAALLAAVRFLPASAVILSL